MNKVEKDLKVSSDNLINKNTNNDKREILRDALKNKFSNSHNHHSFWVMDFDDEFVYYEVWLEFENGHKNFKLAYSITDIVNVTLGDDPIEVVRLTEFKEINTTQDLDKSIGDKVVNWLEKHFSGSKDNSKQLIKQFDDEEMIAIEPLYICADDVDGHGDTMSLEDTHAMVKSLNEANDSGILQTALFHNHKTESFEIVKSWVNEVDCYIGDNLIKEGQPIAKIHFLNDAAWELRKNGTLQGLSIGARFTEAEDLT